MQINLDKHSSHGGRKKKTGIIIRLTHLLLHKLIRAPSPDFHHTMPVSVATIQWGWLCVKYVPRFCYQTHGSVLLSPALHRLCALRIYDAKVRSANGFNGAPTIEISVRRPLPARY